MTDWKYYNHALIPTSAPHEEVDMTDIENGTAWKKYPSALFARWTSDFDCGVETVWWYVIKDTPFDVNALKAKRRYEIKKGLTNFSVKKLDASECVSWAEDLYRVTIEAYSAWPEKYRPSVAHDSFVRSVEEWTDRTVYAAFSAQDGSLCGYAFLKDQGKCLDFQVMRTVPACERLAINAAMVAAILEDQKEFLEQGGYICDGSRSVRHETAFQEYLEKYFGFRKAYCQLHLRYHKKVGWLIKLLYPFRGLLKKMDGIGIVNSLNAILTMEELVRLQTKENTQTKSTKEKEST